MFFFEDHEPPVIPYMEELGLQEVIDRMKERGHRCG